jgi:hypothetical protein
MTRLQVDCFSEIIACEHKANGDNLRKMRDDYLRDYVTGMCMHMYKIKT